ncbi:hypothetical protein L7F22_031812 [Adiantum nelumboides]|nr:hypothetical protein [Adiantum nelumboides]
MDLLLGDILYEGSSQSSDDDSANESFNVGEMVDRDFEGIHENNMPDLFKHLFSLYFSFDRKAYGLMVRDLKGEISVSLEMLKACDVRGMLDLKKWRRMKDTFGLAGVDNGSTCIVQQTQPKLQIACIEDWGNIVKAAHCVRDQIHDDDWATMYMEAKVLKIKERYCIVNHITQLQVIQRIGHLSILQDKWMLEMGIRFSANNAWAIDSTFKTNKYGLPLFAAVLPNQLGVGIPIWFMLCTCDVGARHEVIALEITIKRIFSRMANVRPSALVIDKSQQELDALLRVVNEDPHCWEYTFNGTRRQIACHVLLCWFHTKKAWVEHLLPQVPKEMHEDVYSTMCNIMHSVTEEEFEDRFQLLRQIYSSYARINRSLLELIHALVENSKTGGRMGGTLLRFFKQKQEIADSGRYGVPGNSKERRARLLAGERILQRFEENQNTLQVLNAMQLQFRILSMTTPNQWYQVNFQSNYCDCPDWSSECKHLYGVKLIVKHHFPEMATILPVLDNAHQTLTTYDNEIVTEEKEEKVKTCIHELKELLLSLEQEIPNKSPKDMEIMLHQLRLSKDMLGAMLSPSQIDMPACGSVRQIQAHVTRTRLGHGVPKDVGAPPLEAAPKPIPHTGSLKRKHQRGRSRVQFAKWPRIWCPHCCSKTLLVDPKEVVAMSNMSCTLTSIS